MATGTGLEAQIGFVDESTWGTYVAPTRGFEFISEKIAADVQKVRSKSIRSSRYQRADKVQTYVQGAAGDVQFEVLTNGFGLLFKHMLGAVATTSPGGAKPLEKVHTFTPDANGQKGMSLTAQVGRPDITGTVNPFSYVGGKITAWELSASVGEALMLSNTFDFKTEDTSRALATLAYAAGAAQMLTFIGGTVTVFGSTMFVKSVSLANNKAMATDRHGIGNVKREQVANGEFEITGSLDAEFEALANHTRVTAGTQGALDLLFTYGEIDAGQANPYTVHVTVPVIEFLGDTPTVDGTDIVAHPLKFKGLYNGTNPLITLEYRTTDTTP
jgi:hypothetical protein